MEPRELPGQEAFGVEVILNSRRLVKGLVVASYKHGADGRHGSRVPKSLRGPDSVDCRLVRCSERCCIEKRFQRDSHKANPTNFLKCPQFTGGRNRAATSPTAPATPSVQILLQPKCVRRRLHISTRYTDLCEDLAQECDAESARAFVAAIPRIRSIAERVHDAIDGGGDPSNGRRPGVECRQTPVPRKNSECSQPGDQWQNHVDA